MTTKSEFENEGQGPDVTELKVLFHFSHGSSEVFSVDAGTASIQPETWIGERKVSVSDRSKRFTFLGKLVLERTRSTDGTWETFYYVKIPKPLLEIGNIEFLTIEKDFGQ